jgi:Sulfotransferase domain
MEHEEMSSVTWLASYPKSGNTWARVMLASYLLDGPVPSLDCLEDTVPALNVLMGRGQLVPQDRPGPMVVKSHFLPDTEVMQLYRSTTDKVVYLVRNPRDILLSSARHLHIDAERTAEFALDFIANRGVSDWVRSGWGTWAQNVREWTSPANVRKSFPTADTLVVRYEDMRADTAGKLRDMIEFLIPDTEIDLDRISKAVENSSLEKMRAGEEAERSRGSNAFRALPQNKFIGSGLQAQSLAGLGEDVEFAYQQLLKEDEEFFELSKQFGYDS